MEREKSKAKGEKAEAKAEAKEPEREQVAECARCGRIIYEGDEYITDYNGAYVCGDCRDCHYEKCRECDEWYPTGEMEKYGDEWVCDDCRDRYYIRCSDCGCLVREVDDNYYTTAAGKDICENCYDNNYFRCERCGEIHHNDQLYRLNDEYLCEYCYAEAQNSRNDGVLDYHEFRRRRGYCPRLAEGESGAIVCYGVELEVDKGEFSSDAFDKWTEDDGLIHFEHDGSLSSCGVECITQPCSLRFHQDRMEWDKLCAKLLGQDFRSNDTDTCGLHVHMSREMIPKNSLIMLDVWINRWMLWRDIARRDDIYSGRYDDRKTWHDALNESVSELPSNRVTPLVKKMAKACCCSRYQPLNFCTNNRGKTVEVRIFKGTLRSETVLGILESLDAVIKFAATQRMRDIYGLKQPERFLAYVEEHKAEYPHVFPMLNRLAKERREPDGVMEIIRRNRQG